MEKVYRKRMRFIKVGNNISNKSLSLQFLSRMFELGNDRKQSVDDSCEIQENNTLSMMFPQSEAFEPEETLKILKLKYDSQLHHNNLLNAYFRSHKIKIIDTYHQFNELANLDLKEPPISSFYSNDCFVNLHELGNFLEGKATQYSAFVMDKIPHDFNKLLDTIFIQEGCIPNFQRFLLFYPTYLQKHKALELELFQDNLIDPKIAYFLALIASAELGSIYGINRMLSKFLKAGGNVEWVTKKKYPEKIRRLLKLNRKLARTVWEINSDLIQEIMEGNFWSKEQLALVIQIFAFSHSFATVTLALGLNCEETSSHIIDFKALMNIKAEYDSIEYESNEGQKLGSVIEILTRNSGNSDEENEKSQKQRKKELLDKLQAENSGSRKDLKKSLRRSDNEQNVQNYMKEIGNELNSQEMYFKMHQVFKPLLQDYHVILKRQAKDYPPKDGSDANFTCTAFPLLYNLTNKAAESALDLVTYSQIMTSNNFGKCKIEGTKPFRRAIRYYSQNLCGYIHYDYNYRNIVKYLTMPLKFYVRLLTLSPVHINKQVLREIRHEEGQLNLFDMGHVALLTANCKMGLTLASAIHSFDY